MSEILDCTNGQDREKSESEYGTRFSVLAELPYFDTVRMSIVDPMHNLYLETVKKYFGNMERTGLFTKEWIRTAPGESRGVCGTLWYW